LFEDLISGAKLRCTHHIKWTNRPATVGIPLSSYGKEYLSHGNDQFQLLLIDLLYLVSKNVLVWSTSFGIFSAVKILVSSMQLLFILTSSTLFCALRSYLAKHCTWDILFVFALYFNWDHFLNLSIMQSFIVEKSAHCDIIFFIIHLLSHTLLAL